MDQNARDKAAPRRAADIEAAAEREREAMEIRHADERAWTEARTTAAAALQGYLESNREGAHASAARAAVATISADDEPRVLGMTWYVWAMLIALAAGLTLYDWTAGDRAQAVRGASAAEKERQQIAARCASMQVFNTAFTDFTLIPDTALAGHSKEKFAFPADTTYTQDLNQCAEACRKNTWCKGFDAHFNRCDLYGELAPVANNRCQYWFKRNEQPG